MTIEHLFLFLLLGVAGLLIRHHFNLVIVAEKQTLRYLHAQQLTLLDQSVIFQSFGVKWGAPVPRLTRQYRFEFSSIGDIRYTGHITLTGRKVTDFHLPPHKAREIPPTDTGRMH